jgi:hypothetical protein
MATSAPALPGQSCCGGMRRGVRLASHQLGAAEGPGKTQCQQCAENSGRATQQAQQGGAITLRRKARVRDKQVSALWRYRHSVIAVVLVLMRL